MINYRMIRLAVKETTQMRRHVKLVAQGKPPSQYTEFDANLAKEIAKTSGEYSRNPLKKFLSWVKEFIFNIKSEINFEKYNPRQVPPNSNNSVIKSDNRVRFE